MADHRFAECAIDRRPPYRPPGPTCRRFAPRHRLSARQANITMMGREARRKVSNGPPGSAPLSTNQSERDTSSRWNTSPASGRPPTSMTPSTTRRQADHNPSGPDDELKRSRLHRGSVRVREHRMDDRRSIAARFGAASQRGRHLHRRLSDRRGRRDGRRDRRPGGRSYRSDSGVGSACSCSTCAPRRRPQRQHHWLQPSPRPIAVSRRRAPSRNDEGWARR